MSTTWTPFGSAQWIWPMSLSPSHNQMAQFRKSVVLAQPPAAAPFFITADQAYKLWVNGELAARGPARGYQASWPYDEVDLAAYLRKGENWISVEVYTPGVSTFLYVHQTAAGMICRGAWGETVVASDKTWLCRMSPAHQAHTGRYNGRLNFQERVDARRDDRGWIHEAKAVVDAAGGWREPRLLRPAGTMPWHGAEARGIPMLTKEIRGYVQTRYRTKGEMASDWSASENLTWPFGEELKRLAWEPADGERGDGEGLALVLPAAGEGKLTAVSVDLGRPEVGSLCVEIVGGAGGETVDFYFTEFLHPQGAPAMNGHPDSGEDALSNRLVLREGTTRHEFFHLMGHRYVVVVARGTERELRVKVSLRRSVYPLEVKGSFECSDPTLNEIYDLCVHTQRICMLDAYVDTPWREQAQWWGDARVQLWNTLHLADDTRLLERGIRQIGGQTLPNGLTYGHAPTCAHNCVLPDFTLIWFITFWDHYRQTGSVELFKEGWAGIEKALGYFAGEGKSENGLLRHDPRYWLFLDWCDLHKTGNPALLNLWYVLALQKLAELAGVAGMAWEKAKLEALAARQSALVLEHFLDGERGLMRDGLDAGGRPVERFSVQCQTMAILAGLAEEHHGTMLRERLIPQVRGEKVDSAVPSPYWITYVYEAMRRHGQGRLVIEHIRQHWAPMLATGGCWETWNYRGRGGSTSHAWSAHPLFHLVNIVAGITQRETGWKSVLFAPELEGTGVSRAAAAVPTPKGMIRAAWEEKGEEISVRLELPEGVTALVQLPGREEETVSGGGAWKVKAGQTSCRR